MELPLKLKPKKKKKKASWTLILMDHSWHIVRDGDSLTHIINEKIKLV